MPKGKLIVIEGACDGIGKSTQFSLLKDRLEKEGEIVVTHHFPSYNTDQGRPVELYLKGEFGAPKDLSPYFVNSLYAVDRAVTWYQLLKKEYDKGHTILLDRYTTSSIIYQASVIKNKKERGEFVDFVCDFEYNRLGIMRPDKVIFLHAPFDVVTRVREARTENGGIKNDIHERDIEYMKGVYKNAMEVAKYLHWDMIDCSHGDTLDSIENIHEKVYQKVKK